MANAAVGDEAPKGLLPPDRLRKKVYDRWVYIPLTGVALTETFFHRGVGY